MAKHPVLPTLIDALTFVRANSGSNDPRTDLFMAKLERELDAITDPIWRRELLACLWQTILVTSYLITNDRPCPEDKGDAQNTIHQLLTFADKFWVQQRAAPPKAKV